MQHFFHRDGAGNVLEPQLLYRPYRLETPHGDLAIVFRDHRLSDLIGFTYGSMEPRRAASDLVGHLEAIRYRLQEQQSDPVGAQCLRPENYDESSGLQAPWLVTIALDGENCWEFYPRDGEPFLNALYSNLSDRNDIKLVTVSEFLDKFGTTATLESDRLHSGSWVDGSLTTWIGDPAKKSGLGLVNRSAASFGESSRSHGRNQPRSLGSVICSGRF
jgi:alpha-amylase/alpha-mannosidase (GH57 family)